MKTLMEKKTTRLKMNLILLLFGLLMSPSLFSQTTEDFETDVVGATNFNDNGQNFTITNGPGEVNYNVGGCGGCGWNGTAPDNRFVDNSGLPAPTLGNGSSFTVTTTDGTDIYVNSLYLFISQINLTAASGYTLTIEGKVGGVSQYTITKTSGFAVPFTPNNGFTFIDFTTEGGSDNSNTAVDELIFSTTGNADYLALDAMNWEFAPASCTDPTTPSITAGSTTICPGSSTTLSWAGAALNDATNWHIYTSSCGVGPLGVPQIGTSLVVFPAVTTTYYIRGEDGAGCVDESSGLCGSITITVNPLDDATFNYGASSYCANATDPTPTITTGGGTFTSTAGLSINAGTGVIDVSTSTPGLHTVTYTTTGLCPNVSNVNVTINALDNASYSYASPSYCADATDPTPTITGLGGGTFSAAAAGLSLNAGTGQIDLSASTPGFYVVTYTTAGTCPNSSNVNVTVNATPTAAFTAPNDLCINAGVQNNLGGGTSTGGVYSGPGVTDDGNGMTYDFDPAVAGAGVHTITYTVGVAGCFDSASDFVEVFFLPAVSFTAPTDLCLDAGNQTGLIGGSPAGGVYSGTGVTDAGNGTNYSFDPAVAGVGTHSVTYTYTNANGCTNSASDDIEVFALPVVTFTALNDLCISAGVQNNLGGGTPTGGVYSGTGVTDNGNDTYDFDPAAAGIGTHTLTYTYTNANGCTNSGSDDVEVFGLPTATFTAPTDLCLDAGVQAGLGGGLPTGGVYSGSGVTDDVNGTSYSFDPAAAGVGTHSITYTVGVAGCIDSANDDVVVFGLPTVTFTAPGDVCPGSAVLTGEGGGLPTGGVYSGPGVTDDGNGTTYSFDPATAGLGTHIITFTFTDGNGCSGSANDNIAVADAIAPTAVCQNITAYLDGSGSVTIVAGDLDGGSTDNCGAVMLSIPATTFTCANLGANPVTLTVTDGAGNFASCVSTVTVIDTISPVTTCPGNQNEVASGTCDFTLPDYTSLAFATDNCGGSPTLSQLPIAGTVITANTTITMTSADVNGNSSTCTFDVILDFSACVGAECSNAEALAAMDPCGDLQTVSGSTVGGTPNAEPFCGTTNGSGGATWYTFTGDGTEWTASTVSGATNYDTKIWVYEGTCGALNCVGGNDDFSGVQSQFGFSTTAGLTYYVVVGGFSANEGNYELTLSTVETEAPVAVLATLTDINGVCEITTLTDPSATDNCSAVTVTNDATLPIATSSTITWTYTDVAGNSSTQTQNVVLVDPIAPTASNPDTLYFECIGDAIIDETVVDDEADNCTGAITVLHTGDVVSGDGCNDTITRTYNVADGSGNNIDVTQIIIVHDVTPPTASNATTLNVQCISDVPVAVTGWVTDEADNCGTPTVAFVNDVSDGLTCPETITRTFSVTDNCGNSIDVTQLIVIMDIDAPAPDIALLATETAYCDVTLTSPTATDNCEGTVAATTTTVFPINTLGTTTVTWTYVDACGNSSTQTQDVIVEAIEVETWMAGDSVTIVASNIDAGVTYQWLDCSTNQIISGETNSNYTPTYGSDFAVIVTQNGCSDTSACVNSVVGIDEFQIENIMIYPNPTSGNLKIDLGAVYNETWIKVYDALGQIVISESFGTTNEINLNIEGAPGMYILEISTEEGKSARMNLIKE
jgi:hypothetical protein